MADSDDKMTEDEREIRKVVATWMQASRSGDTSTILSLMTEDVVFMVAGAEPFGREDFEAAANQPEPARPQIDGSNEVIEIQILGDWAFTRNRIDLNMNLPTGETVQQVGYTLTLFRKEADGCWKLARDANLLTAKKL
jgi:uncharacterized protein (TIGR02246 family)